MNAPLDIYAEALERLNSSQTLLQFDPKRHLYTLDGKPMTAVSKIISLLGKGDALTYWAAKVQRNSDMKAILKNPALPEEEHRDYVFRLMNVLSSPVSFKKEAEAAAKRGTRIHTILENWARTKLDTAATPFEPCNDLERAAIASVHGTMEAFNVVPLAAEKRLFFEDLEVAGTFDLLCVRDGKLALVDLKTSGTLDSPRESHRLQQAVYREGLYRHGFPTMESWLLHLHRDSGETAWLRLPDDHTPDFEAFRYLVNVHRWYDRNYMNSL